MRRAEVLSVFPHERGYTFEDRLMYSVKYINEWGNTRIANYYAKDELDALTRFLTFRYNGAASKYDK